jgi:tRNA-splicing ligase RtcB (3'-phosphate/5'-hydroxy nucleic acid ligase)
VFDLMNTKDFLRLSVPLGQATRRATDFISKFILGGGDKSRLHEEVAAIVANPSAFVDDPLRGEFAKALLNAPPPPRVEPVKYRQWGEGLEHDAVMLMEKACLLPVSVAGALVPDAHVGYGLPIGGVLATDNAVIPYAVGVDIACRMKMTVLDIPLRDLEQKQNRLSRAIETETRSAWALRSANVARMTCWTRTGRSARSRNRIRTRRGRNSARAAVAIISWSSACSRHIRRSIN